MGLWTALKSAATGNFSDAGNYLFVDEDVLATQRQVQSNLDRRVREQAETGIISQLEGDQLRAEVNRDVYGEEFQKGGPLNAFTEEFTSRLNVEGIRKSLDGLFGGIFKAIPWYVWAGLAVAGGLWIYINFVPKRA
jgi:hypothetical protein